MSAIAARAMMRHRCDVQRDQNLGQVDAAGNELAPDWQPVLWDEPCYLHSDYRSGYSGEFEIGEGRMEVTRTLYRLMIRRDADIHNFDRITVVRNKLGQTIYEGHLDVEAQKLNERYTVLFVTERR